MPNVPPQCSPAQCWCGWLLCGSRSLGQICALGRQPGAQVLMLSRQASTSSMPLCAHVSLPFPHQILLSDLRLPRRRPVSCCSLRACRPAAAAAPLSLGTPAPHLGCTPAVTWENARNYIYSTNGSKVLESPIAPRYKLDRRRSRSSRALWREACH